MSLRKSIQLQQIARLLKSLTTHRGFCEFPLVVSDLKFVVYRHSKS